MAETKTRMAPKPAAEFLGCGYDWLMMKVRARQIPHYHCGRRVFFTKEALTAWIEQQEQKSVTGE